ncbi:MAG: hypothetical protein AVDCRST_MAG06-1944, partial [uncultured Nocardioides sp.]
STRRSWPTARWSASWWATCSASSRPTTAPSGCSRRGTTSRASCRCCSRWSASPSAGSTCSSPP